MADFHPTTWTELQERLFGYANDPVSGHHRSHFAYRGLDEDYPDLMTSLMRIGGDYFELEPAILRNFKKYADTGELTKNSEWLWLAVGQHHGLPTRLLDWTYSPYVALHFATADVSKFKQDGVIWCVDYVKAVEFLPLKLKEALEGEGAKFTVDLLGKVIPNLSGLKVLEEETREPFLLFIEPPSLDARIVNQYALFGLMSNPRTLINDWLRTHPDLYQRIFVPAKLKPLVRDNLDQANISERMLFPGLDGLCTWLKRHYSPAK